MKLGTDLHVVRARKTVLLEQSWVSRLSTADKPAVQKHILRATRQVSEERLARVEELRRQVQAGLYKVDSLALAEKILSTDISILHIEELNG